MTRYLVSDENPGGLLLEDILHAIRTDILTRCTKIMNDPKVRKKHAKEMKEIDDILRGGTQKKNVYRPKK